MSFIVNNSADNYTLYYNVLDYFKTIMENHPVISAVSQGDVFDFDQEQFPDYPLGNVQILDATFNVSSTDYTIQLIIADKVKNKNNESVGRTNAQKVQYYGTNDVVDIHANTLAVINDLTSYTQRSVAAFEINGAITSEPFMDRFNNGLAGWVATFTLTTHNDRPICIWNLLPTTTTSTTTLAPGPTTTTTSTSTTSTSTSTTTAAPTTTSTSTTSTTTTTTSGPTTTTTTTTTSDQIWAMRPCGTSDLPTVFRITNSATIVAGKSYKFIGGDIPSGYTAICWEAIGIAFTENFTTSVTETYDDCSTCSLLTTNGIVLWNSNDSLTGSVWYDMTSNNNDAIISGSALTYVSGAYFFNGSDNYLTYPSTLTATPSGSWTMQWYGTFNTNDTSSRDLFCKVDYQNGWDTIFSPTQVIGCIGGNPFIYRDAVFPPSGGDAYACTNVVPGEKYLMTMMINATTNTGSFYINTSSVGDMYYYSNTYEYNEFNANSGALTFGYNAQADAKIFSGSMSDLLIYNRILGPTEIDNNYHYLVSKSFH